MLTPEEPRVSVAVESVQGVGDGRWQVTWLVTNDGVGSLTLEAAWIPHGRFRGDGRIPLSKDLHAGASAKLTFLVTAQGQVGTTVENAFLILRVVYDGQPARIFSRMRIEFDAQAVPRPVIELITVQP